MSLQRSNKRVCCEPLLEPWARSCATRNYSSCQGIEFLGWRPQSLSTQGTGARASGCRLARPKCHPTGSACPSNQVKQRENHELQVCRRNCPARGCGSDWLTEHVKIEIFTEESKVVPLLDALLEAGDADLPRLGSRGGDPRGQISPSSYRHRGLARPSNLKVPLINTRKEVRPLPPSNAASGAQRTVRRYRPRPPCALALFVAACGERTSGPTSPFRETDISSTTRCR